VRAQSPSSIRIRDARRSQRDFIHRSVWSGGECRRWVALLALEVNSVQSATTSRDLPDLDRAVTP